MLISALSNDGIQPVCSTPGKATVCSPGERTVNLGAECGAEDDFYYFSPWRNPGSAPVFDACGSAGGRKLGQGHGNFGAAYVDTPHAKMGDLGSSLPPSPSGVTWRAGQEVEVAWALQANHVSASCRQCQCLLWVCMNA